MQGRRIGLLTPSSNTVIEPVVAGIVSKVTNVTVHFSRFRVTEIALEAEAFKQFAIEPMLAASLLLADAKVHAISWSGTSASWLGLDHDRWLCERITSETGIAASTAVLSLFEIARQRGERRLALVTPYTDGVQNAICQTFESEGMEIVAERHLGIRDNFSFGLVKPEELEKMIGEMAPSRPDATIILCTNLAGAPHAKAWEARYKTPVRDSIAACMYGALSAAGVDPSAIVGYGSIFETGEVKEVRL
jgi:maleate isomerase